MVLSKRQLEAIAAELAPLEIGPSLNVELTYNEQEKVVQLHLRDRWMSAHLQLTPDGLRDIHTPG
ncbi:MAG TPA: hypothetical protein VGF15_03450 [Solirubrobacteraceae bacterium]